MTLFSRHMLLVFVTVSLAFALACGGPSLPPDEAFEEDFNRAQCALTRECFPDEFYWFYLSIEDCMIYQESIDALPPVADCDFDQATANACIEAIREYTCEDLDDDNRIDACVQMWVNPCR